MELDEKRLATWRAFLQTYLTIMPPLENEMREKQGLPLIWYNVLTHLNNNSKEGLRLQDLAEAVALSQSGLTRLLDRMGDTGLVERKPCSHDRRGAYAMITPKGQAILEQALPVYMHGIDKHFIQHLNDEDIQALHTVLLKILKAERQ